MRRLLFILFLFNLSSICLASDLSAYIDKFCKDEEIYVCDLNNQRTHQEIEVAINTDPALIKNVLFASEVMALREKYITLHKEWADFIRFIKHNYKNSKYPPKSPEHNQEYQKVLVNLMEGYQEIYVVQININKYKKLVTLCATNCGPLRRIEVQDNLKALESYKETLLQQYPWWVGDDLDKLLANKYDGDPLDYLLNNLIDSLKEMSLYDDKFLTQSHMFLHPKMGSDSIRGEIYEAVSASTLDRKVLIHGFKTWPSKTPGERKLWCDFSKQKSITSSIVGGTKNTVRAGLIALSVSPTLFGLTSRFLPATNLTKLLRTTSTLGMTTDIAIEYKTTAKKCDSLHIDFIQNQTPENLSAYQECIDIRESLRSAVMLSFLPVQTVSQLPMLMAKLKILERAHHILPRTVTSYKEFKEKISKASQLVGSGKVAGTITKSKDNNVFTIIDTSKASTVNGVKVDKYAHDYFNFVEEVFKKRVKLKEGELDSFIDSSKSMVNRTYILTKTKEVPTLTRNTFDGGMAMVMSRNVDEALPLEKATGFVIPRTPGKTSIEISRVAISKEAKKSKDENIFQDLFQQAMRLVASNKDIDNLYVFTSKGHKRLYKEIGINGEVIHTPSERDVIIRITKEDVLNYLSKI